MPRDGDALPGGCDAHERTLMRARSREASRNLISFHDQVIDLESGVGKGVPVHSGQLLDAVGPSKLATLSRRIVRHAAWSHKLVDDVELALVPHFIDELAHEFFEVFSHR